MFLICQLCDNAVSGTELSSCSKDPELYSYTSCICGCMVCVQCYEKYEGKSRCPACRRHINPPSNRQNGPWCDVMKYCSSIPTSLSLTSKGSIHDLLSRILSSRQAIASKVTECSECIKKPASLKCLQCNVCLCSACFTAVHKNSRVLLTHTRVSMSFAGNESICRDHSKRKEMFCRDDGMTVCPDCVENWHSTHRVVHLQVKTEEIVDSIREDYKKTEIVRNLIRRQVMEIDKEAESLMKECQKNSYLAFTTFIKSVAAVQLSYQQFLNDLESSVHVKLETLLKLKDKATNDLTSLNTVLNQAAPLVKPLGNRPLLNPMLLSDRLKKAQRSFGVFERVSEGSSQSSVEEDGVRLPIKFSSDVWKIKFAEITNSFNYELRDYDEAQLSALLSSALEEKEEEEEKEESSTISIQSKNKSAENQSKTLEVRRSAGGGVYDCEELVTISSVKSPFEFYVQRANHPNKSIATILKPESNQQLRTVCKGVMYAAVRHVDGTGDQFHWSRAVVTKIIAGQNHASGFQSADKNINFDKIMVDVLFVDCGTSTTCQVSLLRDLKPNDSEIPYLARCCSLVGVAPPNGESEWSEKQVAAFNDLLMTSSPVYMRVMSCDVDTGCLLVDLTRKPGEAVISKIAPESIRDMLLFHRVARAKVDELLSRVKSKTRKPFRQYLQPVTLKSNTKQTVILGHHDSPQCFKVQLIGRYSERLTELSDQINRFVELSTIKSTYKMIMPRVGMPCLAIFHPCTLWFRAKIVSFDKVTRKVKVLYVDYGNESEVKINECLLIPDRFMKLPYTTFQCRLHNIQPLKTAAADGGDWSDEARNRFMELCENKTFVMYIYEVFDNYEYSVDLFDVADSCMQACELLSVGERLVNEGLAINSTKTPTVTFSRPNDVYRAKRKSTTKQVKFENVSVIGPVKKPASIDEIDSVTKVQCASENEVDLVEKVQSPGVEEVNSAEKVIDSTKKVESASIKEVHSVEKEVDLVEKVQSSSEKEIDSVEKIQSVSVEEVDSVVKVQPESVEEFSSSKKEVDLDEKVYQSESTSDNDVVEPSPEVPQSTIQSSPISSDDQEKIEEEETKLERPQSSGGKTSLVGSSVYDTMEKLLENFKSEDKVESSPSTLDKLLENKSTEDEEVESSPPTLDKLLENISTEEEDEEVEISPPQQVAVVEDSQQSSQLLKWTLCDDKDDLSMFTPEELVVNGFPYEVRVTKVENPSSFYIQTNEQWTMCNEVIRPLHEQIKAEQKTTTARDFNKLLRPSNLVACKSEKEKRWCRGKVLSQKENGLITVRLIDTGVVEDLLPHFVRELPPQFRRLPPFSTRCRLSSVIPAGDVTKWSKCAQDTFKNLIEESSNKKIVVTEVPEADWMPLPVQLFLDGDDNDKEAGRLLHLTGVAMKPINITACGGGKKINEQFRKLMQDYQQADREFQLNYDRCDSPLPQDGAVESVVELVSVKSSASDDDEELCLTVIPLDNKLPAIDQDVKEDEVKGYPQAIPFKVGHRFPCMVAHIVRSDMMYILPDSSPDLPPNDFDHIHQPKLTRIAPHIPCLAPYSTDSKYYRALIYEVVREDDDHIQAKVFFVDYGLDETVDASTLLRLPKEFMSPMQAVLCHVPSVRTVIDDYACPERIALEEIAELSAGANIDCFVEKYDEDDMVYIQLLLKQSVNGRRHIREIADQFEEVLTIKY